ncbi:MAG: aminotransferase class III-fold pyridoxal phosphate-dependent enzyme [Prevotellaceae bacterium]|jgi:acetylornithine aminotransferase|nr:aminotransferase class III-fold pyridoxal phosphate-dependent enzyme [Prevotellaceae bacterium]
MNHFAIYTQWDIEPVEGRGCKLWDRHGVEYLDLYGGHAVLSVGHGHPTYVEAIGRQLAALGFYSNAVKNTLQERLAERLGVLSGYPHYALFLCNSGAEANENALKMASFHTGKQKMIAFRGAFHGRTSGAVAVTDNPAIVAPFNRTENVVFLPLNDREAVERALASGAYAGVIIEGIQGVAGIIPPDDDFLRDLRTLCSKYAAALILDEVQSGYGRTGKFFAHQYAGVEPDLITVAKGMGNGFPVAGVLIAPSFKPVEGMLGSTFGGNHLACAAALAVLEIIEHEGLIARAAALGRFVGERLAPLDAVRELRGRGLMIGIELKPEKAGLRPRILNDYRIFTGSAGAHVIRLLPPLTVAEEELQQLIDALTAMDSPQS